MGRVRRIAVTLGLAAALAAATARELPAGPIELPTLEPAAPARSVFSIQTWRTDEGLPSDVVNAIAQDHDGYLWVGTNAGGVLSQRRGKRETWGTGHGNVTIATVPPNSRHL